MLVLSRKPKETILIGDPSRDIVIPAGRPVRVTVVEVRSGEVVRLGITAPEDVSVHREEVAEEIRRRREAEGGRSC